MTRKDGIDHFMFGFIAGVLLGMLIAGLIIF